MSGLAALGVHRVPVPVPFAEAGGPANVYVIEEDGGGLALFDAGIGTREGRDALLSGFRALGRSLGEVRRIFVSHGHIDHYGYARAAQEESGAPVYAHSRDHDKLTGRDRTAQRLDLYAAYLDRLGAPRELLGHVRVHWQDVARMARPVEHVESIADGTRLRFARFSAEVLHLPGTRRASSASGRLTRASCSPTIICWSASAPTRCSISRAARSPRTARWSSTCDPRGARASCPPA